MIMAPAGIREGRIWHSERQRVLILDFETIEQAEAWDAADRPISLVVPAHQEAS